MSIGNDRPISDQSQDLFGYAPFAETIAKGIVERKDLFEPHIVGIEASWGMGKTSAANLVVGAINELTKGVLNDTRRVQILRFSPWLSASLEAMAVSYIGELAGALQKSFGHRLGRNFAKVVKKLIKRYGRLASAGAGLAATPFGFGAAVGGVTTALLELAQESTEALAGQLRTQLRLVDAGQLVVIVDDIDRLHPDEMRNLLTLVKTFGDLPRVVHLLLYDRGIVNAALERAHSSIGQEGPTYLEKVVQLSTALPAIEHFRLRDFLVGRLKLVAGENQYDEQRLREL